MMSCPVCSGSLSEVFRNELVALAFCPCNRFSIRFDLESQDGEWFLHGRAGGVYLKFLKGTLWAMVPGQAPDLVPKSRVCDTMSWFEELCLTYSVLST